MKIAAFNVERWEVQDTLTEKIHVASDHHVIRAEITQLGKVLCELELDQWGDALRRRESGKQPALVYTL